jgi:NDP-sugar pyrophosphorylase family protein
MDSIKIKSLFDLDHTILKSYLEEFEFPWEALDLLFIAIINLGNKLDLNEYKLVKENVWVHKTAKIYPSAYIDGPTIICEGAEIRHSAFIRGSAVIGKNAVVGNSCEIKNSILFDFAQVPHFNYIGDSILGFKAHMGAGAVTSNLKQDKSLVVIHSKGFDIETGLKKVGAFLGDFVEVGCNSVLNPGTVVGKNSNIYPLSSVRGVVGENIIYKQGKLVEKR